MLGKKQTGERYRAAFAPLILPRSLFFRTRVLAAGPQSPTQLSHGELATRLRCFELFADLSLTALQEVAALVTVRAYRRGEFLWQWGDPAEKVALIDSGFVKAGRRDRKGVSKTYALFGPGDSLGLFAFYAGMRYPTDAVALNEGLILLFIEAVELTRLAHKYPALAEKLQGEVTRFTEAFINKIEVITAGSIAQRLAVLMMQLIGRYGVAHRSDQAQLPIVLPQELIGEIIGARVETVARVLARWKRDGWIATDAHGYHFHCLDKLRGLLPN